MRFFLVFYITHEQSMVDLDHYTQANCMKYKSEFFPTESVIYDKVRVQNSDRFLGVTGITEVSEEEFNRYK